MSADKRALDDLDALFRAVPAQLVSPSRPVKKLRSGSAGVRAHALSGSKEPAEQSRSAMTSTAVANDSSQQERIMYAPLPAAILPKAFRGGPSVTPRGGGGGGNRGQSTAHSSSSSSSSSSRAATAVGAAAAHRLKEFVRGVLGARGNRAAAAAMESRLERKVMHLENVAPGQTEAQSAGARAGRAAGGGLSGKKCKKMGLNALGGRGKGKISFRDMLGLHGLWKDYAVRLISQCAGSSGSGANRKLIQQRILAADLQGCYLTVSQSSVASLVNVAGIVLRETHNTFQLVTPDDKTKTISKHSCAVRLAFGGQVVDLNARALKGRRGRGRGRDRNSGGGTADDVDVAPLTTAAL